MEEAAISAEACSSEAREIKEAARDRHPRPRAKLQREMLMRRSPAERLAMGCAMFDVARRLMRAGLGDPHGTDNSPEMKVQLFLRTYGSDFEPAARDRIVAWLRAGGPTRRLVP